MGWIADGPDAATASGIRAVDATAPPACICTPTDREKGGTVEASVLVTSRAAGSLPADQPPGGPAGFRMNHGIDTVLLPN